VIQQNASASEEMASMSEELSSQAEQLTETMSFFKIEGNAAAAKGPEREVRVARTTRTPAPVGAPSRTAKALAKRESATDGDYEQF